MSRVSDDQYEDPASRKRRFKRELEKREREYRDSKSSLSLPLRTVTPSDSASNVSRRSSASRHLPRREPPVASSIRGSRQSSLHPGGSSDGGDSRALVLRERDDMALMPYYGDAGSSVGSDRTMMSHHSRGPAYEPSLRSVTSGGSRTDTYGGPRSLSRRTYDLDKYHRSRRPETILEENELHLEHDEVEKEHPDGSRVYASKTTIKRRSTGGTTYISI